MPKLRPLDKARLEYFGEGHEEYWFWCPGCKMDHRIIAKWGPKSGRTEPQWNFNGSLERPTFTPSLLARWTGPNGEEKVCHSYVTDGKIQFLGDCTHELNGQTVELKEITNA